MSPAHLRYNERSWGADLVGVLNAHLTGRRGSIVRVGAEYGLAGERTLYPDLLFFGASGPLLGCELKFPDTPLYNEELLENAKTKADRLGLQAFLVWNVTSATLHCREDENFHPHHTWPALPVDRREDVEAARPLWENLACRIADDIEQYFADAQIAAPETFKVYSDRLIADIISARSEPVKENILVMVRESAALGAKWRRWWEAKKLEYPKDAPMENSLARMALAHWLNAFLFAHLVRTRFRAVFGPFDAITPDTTQAEAIMIFGELSRGCDFAAMFTIPFEEALLDEGSWTEVLRFHVLLGELNLEGIDQGALAQVLERTRSAHLRKLHGQFATPSPLAKLLVRLGIENTMGHILDPCCGTGGILRASRDLKIEHRTTPNEALSTVWGSDKFAPPLQSALLALAHPDAMGSMLRLFCQDILDLQTDMEINFRDPEAGQEVVKHLPAFSSVVSNLPFVRFEKLDAERDPVNEFLAGFHAEALSRKSDLYAYILPWLWTLLEGGGRVAVIVSNAWLGVDWARQFRRCLLTFFKLESVVTSGIGRWFEGPDVVTNILVLSKRDRPGAPEGDEPTTFFVTERSIHDWDQAMVERMSDAMLTGNSAVGLVNAQSHTHIEIEGYAQAGLEWNAFFCDLSWLPEVTPWMRRAEEIWEIARGERRGWNDMFYPSPRHGVEPEYIRPVLPSTRNVRGLTAHPEGEAFCCSESMENLERGNKHGALAWIRRFEVEINGTGRPLPEALARAGQHWYEMRPETMADVVVSMNPGNRLLVIRLEQRAFVDQRLIRFMARGETDITLCHALMNSLLGLFYLEALGLDEASELWT